MADANRVQVSTLEEKTWGTTNTYSADVLVNGAGAVGDTTVDIDTGSHASVIAGDTFTVAGDTQVYIVVSKASSTLTFSPAE